MVNSSLIIVPVFILIWMYDLTYNYFIAKYSSDFFQLTPETDVFYL